MLPFLLILNLNAVSLQKSSLLHTLQASGHVMATFFTLQRLIFQLTHSQVSHTFPPFLFFILNTKGGSKHCTGGSPWDGAWEGTIVRAGEDGAWEGTIVRAGEDGAEEGTIVRAGLDGAMDGTEEGTTVSFGTSATVKICC
jgi:hypothetical protein